MDFLKESFLEVGLFGGLWNPSVCPQFWLGWKGHDCDSLIKFD